MQTKLPGKKFTLTQNTLSINARILEVLRAKSHAYISGEQLSQELNMSRTAIWKHVNALRDLGYKVEAITSVGYKLVSSPELLLPLEVKNGLNTRVIGQNIHWEYEVNSTNTLALQLADQGSPEGTLVVSESQKQGRGRLGRSWISQPETGIYMSLILRPTFVPMKASCITFISAIAVTEAIKEYLGIDAKIKWPNDVMIRGKKTAGILTELRAEMESIHYVIVGIGINVNNTHFPKALSEKVTSLALEYHEKVSRIKLLQALLRSFERWYLCALKEQPGQTFERWRDLSCTLGNLVEVNLGDEIVRGLATRLEPNGSLYLKLDSSEERQILAGDVTMVASI
ncbi:MAG: biotin--[acetyl-CoA-carboxylase] ligase [Candidatus Vecturithrix sp.]|jgi:BirA family biotin operon repressor/biotin-[acetyl-CoA-carboxylase] ligase|nr:biotin--[acetyl-CoA-carboxylase] ligase [Candidatus Vecturithrix sp.]